MNIYLIRHAEAENISLGIKDYNRKLTQDGEKILFKAAKGWQNLITSFDFLVSSPLIRALQTAQIVKEVYEFKDEIIVDSKLAPGSYVESIIEISNSLKGNNIAFFGHEPDFSQHTSDLISNSISQINFKKSTIAKISFEGKAKIGRGILEFLIPAKLFK